MRKKNPVNFYLLFAQIKSRIVLFVFLSVLEGGKAEGRVRACISRDIQWGLCGHGNEGLTRG